MFSRSSIPIVENEVVNVSSRLLIRIQSMISLGQFSATSRAAEFPRVTRFHTLRVADKFYFILGRSP